MTKESTNARKVKWDKDNTTMVSVKLQNRTDSDILQYLDGESRQTIIKAALREYMERHPKKREFSYGMRLRGYSPGCQPKGVLRREDDSSGKYHDIIVYGRQLSADEIRDYELEELK